MTLPTLFWFRRDLRIADNPALCAAARQGPVVGVFVKDRTLQKSSGAPRLAFLANSLAALTASMNGALTVLSGDPGQRLLDTCEKVGAKAVFATTDFGPYGRNRDARVATFLESHGIAMRYIDTPYAIAPGTIFSGAGTPYKVFTPFFRAWKDIGWPEPVAVPDIVWCRDMVSESFPEAFSQDMDLPVAGERAAHETIDTFLAGPVHDYQTQRDIPGVAGTSRLSPYLKWGTIHPRQVLDRLGDSPSEDVFRSELAWREFYADVLFWRPDSTQTAFVKKMGAMVNDEGVEADRLFEAWCHGQTGFPIVDAGMRQLMKTGWMHNRVRMITASFLVKDLHLDWRRGARWFMEHLVDGDIASNSHGWQWVAGTGTDASPYFRVFNPTTQSRKFDSDGAYIRHWVPELGHLFSKHIHAPALDPHGAPAGYPAPIVDHAAERIETLARYEQLKRSWSA